MMTSMKSGERHEHVLATILVELKSGWSIWFEHVYATMKLQIMMIAWLVQNITRKQV